MSGTRVLLADACPLFRAGAHSVLTRDGEFVVLEAVSLAEVVTRLENDSPELAIVDLALPPEGGLEAVRMIDERATTRTVVWSLDPSGDDVLSAVRSGARGYLTKTVSPEALVRTLRALRRGEAALPRSLSASMIEALHGLDRRGRARERASLLSDRELEVLGLVARGSRNRQIAQALRISEFTVKRHVQNILQKLGVASRSAAAAFYTTAFDGEAARPEPLRETA